MSNGSHTLTPRLLLEGLAMPESPRWHQGRLWFSNWGAGEIIAVDLDGNSEIVADGPEGLGWAVNWLPDGRMLITGDELMRVEPDGTRVRHADLSAISEHGWSELTVDGRGNVYVNTIGFDFADFGTVMSSGRRLGRSPWSRPMDRSGRSPTRSRSPTGWSSHRITGP
jgi:sugar lactone lactonase YvrE